MLELMITYSSVMHLILSKFFPKVRQFIILTTRLKKGELGLCGCISFNRLSFW